MRSVGGVSVRGIDGVGGVSCGVVVVGGQSRGLPRGGRGLVARGGFIEDKFGQAQLADILRRGVVAAHPDYGTWIWDDGVPLPMVGHLDGRDAQNVNKYHLLR